MYPADNGRGAGPGEIYNALLDGMYAQSDWPSLANALGAAASGNSTVRYCSGNPSEVDPSKAKAFRQNVSASSLSRVGSNDLS